MSYLTLEQQIGQLLIPRISGFALDQERLYPDRELDQAALDQAIQEFQVGGLLVFGGEVTVTQERISKLQAQSQLPLLICADLEEGAGQHFNGATRLPPALALAQGGTGCSFLAGRITAQEALAIGVNWVLAPVADVNANPLNPVINVRAFGTTAQQVTTQALACAQGLGSVGVVRCAKHFPGHGDVDSDSHLALPLVALTRQDLERDHWQPFRELCQAGIESIMIAHLLIPDLDPYLPASLSPVITQILRQEWGFEGLIVTDALTMHAITHDYGPVEAALLALEAGADILLMPPDLAAVYHGIRTAVAQGRLSADRIAQSVERILRVKAGFNQSKPANAPFDHDVMAQDLYQRSLIIKIQDPWPDLSNYNHWQNFVIGAHTGPVTKMHPGTQVIDPHQPPDLDQVAPLVLVHLLLTTGPYQSFTQLDDPLIAWLLRLQQRTRLILISLGNPYLLSALPPQIERILAFSPQAQQAVVNRLKLV